MLEVREGQTHEETRWHTRARAGRNVLSYGTAPGHSLALEGAGIPKIQEHCQLSSCYMPGRWGKSQPGGGPWKHGGQGLETHS